VKASYIVLITVSLSYHYYGSLIVNNYHPVTESVKNEYMACKVSGILQGDFDYKLAFSLHSTNNQLQAIFMEFINLIMHHSED